MHCCSTRPHRTVWLAALLTGLAAVLWLAPTPAQAGTITIVDGPDTPPTANGVYTDGYIQNVLSTLSGVVITTTGVITGPNEIRVLEGVVITWTNGNELTLDAGSEIVITGTIQHNGPANGQGGVRLRVSGDPNGFVRVGTGIQSSGVAVGSRHGVTRVDAGNLVLTGGISGIDPFALLGFRAVDQGAPFTVTGVISVTVRQNVLASAGAVSFAYVQIGHGGGNLAFTAIPSCTCTGPIAVEAGGDVTFQGGGAYAQLGNGGAQAEGNHSGNHRLAAGDDVAFRAGNGPGGYAQFGNGGINATGDHSGNHTLTAGSDAGFLAGATQAYVQMGNGGLNATGVLSGNHRLDAAGDVQFQAGDNNNAYAQLGNGGFAALSSHSGDHTLEAGGDVTFAGGGQQSAYAQMGNGGYTGFGNHSGNQRVEAGRDVTFEGGFGNTAYAQLGNGGSGTDGTHSGSHSLTAGGDVAFQGIGPGAYAQMGNGGASADGNHSGSHTLTAVGNVRFQGGVAPVAYAHLGNGGFSAVGNFSGGHTLNAGGDVTFQAGGSDAYALFGNGGIGATGSLSGSHTLAAAGDVSFLGSSGDSAAALFGNGGLGATGSLSGSHTLVAEGDVSFLGGSGIATDAQMGNGGPATNGSQSGALALTAAGNLTLTRGSGFDAYAMIGHGADVRNFPTLLSDGYRSGNITLRIGATAVLSGSQVGHVTNSNPLSVTAGNTLIGVSQSNPFSSGTGQLLVTGSISSSFSSAPTALGGQLRIYLPRADSQQVPTSVLLNGSSFAVANTIPPAQLAGIAPFGAGPYIPPYSFYLGGQPNVGISKTATPAGPLNPGQALTYTLSFSNTGDVTTTGVVVQDALPSAITLSSATPQPDAGVFITQTTGAPNLAWNVSGLGNGKGGRIIVVATVHNETFVLGTTFTNTATIATTGDITLTNNAASVVRSVIPGATLIITKTVVGTPPGSGWQFTGSGGLGGFNLPAAGGNQTFIRLLPATYSVTETTKTNYTAAVACTTGASGSNSVSVNLASGQQVGCTFTNTFVPPTVITQTLTVNKAVVGGPLDADDFALFVDDAPVSRGVPKALSTGQHTVTETSVPTYTATFGGACNAAGQVTLASGTHVSCTITNTYAPGVITQTLTVNKVVVGGPLEADDFDLFVDGSPVTRGVAKALSAGQHTVSETSVATYTAAFGGACNAAGVVNLAAGSHLTCTITNTYTTTPQTGGVAGLVYVDENGNELPDTGEGLQGVTVTLQSETGVVAGSLLVDLTDVTDGSGEYGFADVPVGDYTLSFAPPAGYRAIDPAEVTVTAGQTTQAPERAAVPDEPSGPDKVYVPVIQHSP